MSRLSCQKHLFSLPASCHYLNCAYMSPLSKRVQEAGMKGVKRKAVPSEIVEADFFEDVDTARSRFSRLLGATDPTRIAIIPSASYGLATVTRNTPLAKGQNVVTIARQFPSNVHSWRRICSDAEAELRSVECPAEASLGAAHTGPRHSAAWNEALLAAIDGDTAAVAVEPIHWTDGTRFDLGALADRAREVGAALVIDGTQTVGAEPFDFERLRPDAVICAAYKWLTGPYSIGAAYLGARYDDGVPIEESWLTRSGSRNFASLGEQGQGYRPGAIRYDVGETSNFVLMPMFVAALDQLLEWGVAGIAAYIADLTASLIADDRLTALGLGGPMPETPHLFGLRLPDDVDPELVRARLREDDVFVSVRGRAVRVSPHVYNDLSDIDALAGALAAVVRD